MASLGGAGESVAVVAGAGELGSATATLLAEAGFTVVPVDRTPQSLDELPEGIRSGVGNTTDQAVAKTLIDPTAGMAAYGRSKAALSHLVRILDLELRPHGIGVNAGAPQLRDTSRNRAGLPAEVLAYAVRPEAAADIIAFLPATAPHPSAARSCQPTAPSAAASHPAPPPHLTRS